MVKLFGAEECRLGISVLVKNSLVIEAAGSRESCLKRCAHIGELPDVHSDYHRIFMEELKAVTDKVCLIILAPTGCIKAPVTVHRCRTEFADDNRLMSVAERVASLSEIVDEGIPGIDASAIPTLVLIETDYVAVLKAEVV